MKRIAVIGSINMDLTARADRLPGKGETVSAKNFQYVPGGKGANQAVDMSFSERAVEIYENATLIKYEGELHGFSAGGRVTAAQDVYRFIVENCKD